MVKVSTLEALNTEQSVDLSGQPKKEKAKAKNLKPYQNQFFEPCKQLKASEVDSKNYGLNISRTEQQEGNQTSHISEIDEVMQALRLMPDLDEDDG